jgi:hypothetical protein
VSQPLAQCLALAGGAGLAAVGAPAAIVNKQLARRGHETFATPAEMAGVLFDGSTRVSTAFQVITSLVLLGAVAATLAGVWQLVRGERGGLALTASGAYGVLGLIAALSVVM